MEMASQLAEDNKQWLGSAGGAECNYTREIDSAKGPAEKNNSVFQFKLSAFRIEEGKQLLLW